MTGSSFIGHGKVIDWVNDCKVELLYSQTRTEERPGGQHAGSPHMFVRVTHVPTGIVADCGEARSRFLNKQIALGMIEYALVELEYL